MLATYRALFKIHFALKAQYRSDSLIWLLSITIEPIVYLMVWMSVAAARGGRVGDYRGVDIAAYYLIFLVIRQMTIAPSPYRFAQRIRSGEMSQHLMRPLHMLHWDLAEIHAQKVFPLLPLSLLMAAIALTFGVQLDAPWWAWLAFVPAVLLASALRFAVQWALSCVAFWTTHITGIWNAYLLAQTFLGGFLAPLTLLPMPLQTLATLSPFRWIFTFPIDVLMGRLSPGEVLIGLTIQGVYTLAMAAVLAWVWRAGVRQYSAVGG